MRRLTAVLVANRGEIAVRILRAAADLGIATVAVHSEDDDRALHVRRAHSAVALRGAGPAAYLDVNQLVEAALGAGCDAVHPGYGFLSEHAGFARACADAGLTFVGPTPDTLELLGDKTRARALAERCGVPVLRGTPGPAIAEAAAEFLRSLGDGGAMMIKAVAGGGGRGMRVVRDLESVEAAHERCRSEALTSFGSGDVYAEELLDPARHIEVQIVGDGSGSVSHVWERECSIQRRHQKLLELAPAPHLDPALRRDLLAAAVAMAEEVRYRGLGTFEFLVSADAESGSERRFAFIEANPRLQVEHTVTEEVTGIDLVQTQLLLAGGGTLADVGLEQADVPEPRGLAVQVRVNMETMAADGTAQPSGGTIAVFEPPAGPGVRVDSFAYAGYRTSPRFDSLLAKVITHSRAGELGDALDRTYRALSELRIEGVPTNVAFLQSLVRHPDLRAGHLTTRFVEEHVAELVDPEAALHRKLYFEAEETNETGAATGLAGVKLDSSDPLAVLRHGRGDGRATPPSATASPPDDGTFPVLAPLQGTIVSIDVAEGEAVQVGGPLLVMEAMKMEHVVTADRSGIVRRLTVSPGDTVFQGHPLVTIEETEVAITAGDDADEVDLDHVRPDLAEVLDRHRVGLDEARPDAVERRRSTGQRTARENVDDLCDDGSFVEFGPLVIAGQRRRRPVEELIARTPADGLVAGIGSVNGDLFEPERAQCMVLAYDYTVLAGTQGIQNHRKKDRMFELAERARLPLVIFAEGGGGRPGDTDGLGVAGFDGMAFHLFGRLSGLVPMVGVASGRCFAGNAALLGCCDVVIATEDSNIGMGGPAMIEGGGLGIFRPEEIGPMAVQVPNGVVDLPVADEAEAVAVAKRYLSYFQGPLERWESADQRRLRSVIPENRLRIYDVRTVIETLADTDSVLEIRRHFGLGMVTALVRIEGRPMGVIANNPTHLAGAIDSDGADKASRFMQLCDAHGLPILFLCDTPGIMVGPEAERTALVRHCSRMFITGAHLSVPIFTVVLRKSYGLGALTMAGGSFRVPFFTVTWPTGEFGGMGLEGAVKLGYRNDLAAIDDPDERRALYEEMVARMYEHGKALNAASHFELDDVIDPAATRRWILNGLLATDPAAGDVSDRQRRPFVDSW